MGQHMRLANDELRRGRGHNEQGERGMNSSFRRLLADYVEYHRDPYNCAMHVFGILLLFLAASLPLSLWVITLFEIQISVATIALTPVLIFWLVLDFELGAAILAAVIALLAAAAVILNHVTTVGMWSLAATISGLGVALLIIGHLVFEPAAGNGRQSDPSVGRTHVCHGEVGCRARLSARSRHHRREASPGLFPLNHAFLPPSLRKGPFDGLRLCGCRSMKVRI